MTGHNIWDFGEIPKIIPKLYLLFLFYLVLYLYVRLYNKRQGSWLFVWAYASLVELENVFVKHYAPNHMPDPKGQWSLKENNSELHYGICSKVYQFIYTLVCNYMPIMRILAKAILQISRSKGCFYTKCLCPKKESNATENLQNRFKS